MLGEPRPVQHRRSWSLSRGAHQAPRWRPRCHTGSSNLERTCTRIWSHHILLRKKDGWWLLRRLQAFAPVSEELSENREGLEMRDSIYHKYVKGRAPQNIWRQTFGESLCRTYCSRARFCSVQLWTAMEGTTPWQAVCWTSAYTSTTQLMRTFLASLPYSALKRNRVEVRAINKTKVICFSK